MINTLNNIISDLESKLLELKEYKKKLLDAQIRYANFRHYIKEKELEKDFFEWQMQTSSSKNLADTIEYQGEIIKQEFEEI